jgi:pyruvate/2-oxoglutarate dehydrogenase complex dihydrolipoamide dehydrogenase (E3) component
VSSPPHEFDVIVVGAGPSGEVVAGRLSKGGKRVALVERHLVGGECSYYACMPSKALLRPGELLDEVTRVPGAAEAVKAPVDVGAALARRDEVVHNLSDAGQLPWLEEHGITLVRGDARLAGERRLSVGETELVAREVVVLATGSGPVFPPVPRLREAGAWSSHEITVSHQVPARLIVLGGGVVGVEMAQAWSRFGSEVMLVEALDRLLAQEEPLAGEELEAAFEKSGIDVRVGVHATAVSRDDQVITVELDDGSTATAERLLVAIGRKVLTENLGLETIGLSGEGHLDVDDHLRVQGLPWLYAVGDINRRSLLTHSGKYQARIAADHILGHESAIATADTAGAPRVVFTDPQVAAVGLTLAGAREAGVPVIAIDLATSATAGASFHGRNAPGTTRFVVDTERDVLVGATFVGPEMAESLHAATIAVAGEVPIRRLAHAIAAFPTRSELWLKFIEAYEGERGYSVHSEA